MSTQCLFGIERAEFLCYNGLGNRCWDAFASHWDERRIKHFGTTAIQNNVATPSILPFSSEDSADLDKTVAGLIGSRQPCKESPTLRRGICDKVLSKICACKFSARAITT